MGSSAGAGAGVDGEAEAAAAAATDKVVTSVLGLADAPAVAGASSSAPASSSQTQSQLPELSALTGGGGSTDCLKRWPLFVKPDDAYGSMGISDACVCRDRRELTAQVAALRSQGFTSLMIEPFLDGHEYSVLITDAIVRLS